MQHLLAGSPATCRARTSMPYTRRPLSMVPPAALAASHTSRSQNCWPRKNGQTYWLILMPARDDGLVAHLLNHRSVSHFHNADGPAQAAIGQQGRSEAPKSQHCDALPAVLCQGVHTCSGGTPNIHDDAKGEGPLQRASVR